MSRVGVLLRLHNAVGNLATYIWLRQSFVAISFECCRYFLAHACRLSEFTLAGPHNTVSIIIQQIHDAHIHVWSESHCYPSSAHNRYPAINVGCQE